MVVFHTSLWVKCHTNAKTAAWVNATVILLPFGGNRKTIPGVNTRNKRNTYNVINQFI